MITEPVCLDDLEEYAKSVLPKNVFEKIRCGAGYEKTLAANRRAFDRYLLRPRVLRNVSSVDLSTTVLGHKIAFPVGISPSGMHRVVHPEGEKATARAAASKGTCMILSTSSTVPLEEVMEASSGTDLLWFQLYIFKNRDATKDLIRRVEAAKYSALVVTVDAPIIGRRLNDLRLNFSLPPHLELANFNSLNPALRPKAEAKEGSGVRAYVNSNFDSSISWEDIKWLKEFTPLPIVLKGIMTAEDARIAADLGVAAIFVSNHGGRQLDDVLGALEVLPEIVAAVRGRPIEVYLDSGIRTGTDVIKALLLGARAVFVGRPAQWALAYNGEKGVRHMLEIIEEEFRVAMALIGATSITRLERSMISRASNL